jgi:S-adenosylmethionine:tRNA ribosyltransferase-isomerase
VRAADLEYDLPPALIAQTAAEPRSSARLLAYDRASRDVRHLVFGGLLDALRPDDLVVVNDTRVLPARVRARRASGGAVELLLLERGRGGRWDALARPARRLRAGEVLDASGSPVRVEDVRQNGHVTVTLADAVPGTDLLDRIGELPLPPYIHHAPEDPGRYQTVFARRPGSAAAPTAGLHFTAELWRELRRRFEVVAVTLAVGIDTFRPVAGDAVESHPIHTEAYAVAPATRRAVDAALAAGRRVVAIGTTTVRVLETVWGDPSAPDCGRTALFITPGYRFRATGAMVTNFHMPRSTLLALVMAFAGTDEVRRLYALAVAERYRFLSFGDAMLIT